MRKYLKEITLFIAILMAYFGFMYSINSLLIRSNEHKFISTKKVLVLGDSHTRRAISPKILSGSINISQNSEPYYITLWKLREFTINNDIEFLILGFSYHNISEFNDLKLIDSKWSAEMFRRTYSIHKLANLKNIEIDYKSFYITLFDNLCIFPKLNHNTYIGSYSNSNSTILTNYEEIIERHYSYNNIKQGISVNEIFYLDQIVNLCIDKKIKLIMVTTLLHDLYFERIPKYFIDGFNNLRKKYIEKGVLLLNYARADYSDDYFLNSDHLNEKGALKFSREIKNYLNERY